MVQDQIRYDILVQDALRNVIRKVLSEVAKAGLPGDHHFFITFLTHAEGVKISSRLKERYPEQMTIILQHQFWDLCVTDSQFEVSLSFGDVAEKLIIPFSAVQVFYDPAAAFEAAFDLPPSTEASTIEPTNEKLLSTKKLRKSTQKVDKDRSQQPEATANHALGAPKPVADVVSLDAFRKNKE